MPESEHSGFARYPLEHAALGLLMSGPSHGYDLYRRFSRDFGSIWKAGQTRFYLALNALERDGLLSASAEVQANRPARRVYHLTEAGRRAFLDWLHTPVRSMRAVRVEFIARLRFFNLLALPGAQALIEQQQAIFGAMLAEWEQARDASADPFHAAVEDFRIRQARFLIEWLDSLRGRGDLFPADFPAA